MSSVDQTPLPFTFTDGPAYKNKSAKAVWVQGRSSVLVLRESLVGKTLANSLQVATFDKIKFGEFVQHV